MVNTKSIRLLIANLIVKFLYVKIKYLYSDLEETLYMSSPSGYEKLIGINKVCKLKNSIYDLHRSARIWKYENEI